MSRASSDPAGADRPSAPARQPPGSARPTFDRELASLEGAVLTLGEMVDTAVYRAADALERRSVTMARRVVREDGPINRHRADIEADTLQLLGRQAPTATDLRLAVAALHITTDLERMGDYAANVGRHVLALLAAGQPAVAAPDEVQAIADLDRTRLAAAMAALRARDGAAARVIAAQDAAADALQDTAYRALLRAMHDRPACVPQATLLLRSTYAFEHIGDRVTNICEWVIYLETGRMEELSFFPGDRD
jgi:phosphate transport system protein